eukprot:756989-Hanusia_phi.AAC.1
MKVDVISFKSIPEFLRLDVRTSSPGCKCWHANEDSGSEEELGCLPRSISCGYDQAGQDLTCFSACPSLADIPSQISANDPSLVHVDLSNAAAFQVRAQVSL